MSFLWEQYLDLAERLAVEAAPAPHADRAVGAPEQGALAAAAPAVAGPVLAEAALRTAVSRAYYAAYHLARAHLEREGRGLPDRVDSHRWVWEQFGGPGPGPRQGQRIRTESGRLKVARKNADYESELPSGQGRSASAATPESRVRRWKEEADFAIRTARSIQTLLDQIQPRH